ncbi:MAG: ribonuclease HII [Candidatus Omnitrophica bacterium]|nr:ribonuclease HII [Candidatus Omnitrophota bacterium]
MDVHEIHAVSCGFKYVVGVDEAGRGPLAGPVVASAVVLKENVFKSKIGDSKKLSPNQREKAYSEIIRNSYFGIGIVEPDVIDRINILQAAFLAMNNAVEKLTEVLQEEGEDISALPGKMILLIDGNRFTQASPYRFETIIKGDQKVLSIMCASILAKVTRDRIMEGYDKIFPQYGFSEHKGYPTKEHKDAIREYGMTSIHRKTFKHD